MDTPPPDLPTVDSRRFGVSSLPNTVATAARYLASLLITRLPFSSRPAASQAADERRDCARLRDEVEFGERSRDYRLEHQMLADATELDQDHRRIA